MSSICANHETPHGHATFEDTVVPLIADVYRTARRMARQDDEAREVMQEALLRALKGFKRFRPGSNPRAWLRTIVRSVFLTRYRKRQREPHIVGHDIERLSGEMHAETFTTSMFTPSHQHTSLVISHRHLRDAFHRLPPPFREAVRLVDIDELTYDEAALALGCPVNTLKSRLSRGRRRLSLTLRNDLAAGAASNEKRLDGTGR